MVTPAHVQPPDTMRANEAWTKLGISRQRLYQLVAMNRIDSIRVGRSLFIPIKAVEDRIAAEHRLKSSNCISLSEVADFFGVDPMTITRWHTAGLLKGSRVRNRVCFATGDIIAFTPPENTRFVGEPTRTIRGRHFPVEAAS